LTVSALNELIDRVAESAHAGNAHFRIWFTLRGKNKALSKHYEDMNDPRYREFFRASGAGHYKLFFIELGCLFDSNPRAASFRALKRALMENGFSQEAERIHTALSQYKSLIPKILTIRSKLMAHKEIGADSEVVHRKNGITPNQIESLFVTSCKLINEVVDCVYEHGFVPNADPSSRLEEQTLALLKVISCGRS
jgi:hypothetical protein